MGSVGVIEYETTTPPLRARTRAITISTRRFEVESKQTHVEIGFMGVTAVPLVNDTVLGLY